MSRYYARHKQNPSRHCAYGFDATGLLPGYFVSLPDGTELDTRAFLAVPPNASSRAGLLAALDPYDVPPAHRVAIAGDLPF